METKVVSPIAAFDLENGSARKVADDWPTLDAPAGYRWLHFDLADPAIEDWVGQTLPQIAALSLLQKETRPRCERHANGLILNLRAVNLNPQSTPEDMVSLRMWVTPQAIVSARMRKIFAVADMAQSAEQGVGPPTVGQFLADLIHGLMSRIEAVSLELEERTDEYEEQVSEGVIPDPNALGGLRQTVIKMRRFINPQREAITALADTGDWLFSKDETALVRETSNRTRRTIEELDAIRDRLTALQEQLDASRALALGRNSYILSVVAAIFLPLGFLTGLFGVNVAGMPGTEEPVAFWVLSGVSAASGFALFLIFKFARWL